MLSGIEDADRAPRSVLAVAGALGGLLWIVVVVASPDAEITRNRIWTLALLLMFLGLMGLMKSVRNSLGRATTRTLQAAIFGLGLMVMGSFVEYWILYRLPHQGGGAGSVTRGLAWMTFLLGAAFLAIGSMAAGAMMLRTRAGPTLVGVLLMLLLPATVALGLVGQGAAAVPIATLSSIGLVLRPGCRAIGTGDKAP